MSSTVRQTKFAAEQAILRFINCVFRKTHHFYMKDVNDIFMKEIFRMNHAARQTVNGKGLVIVDSRRRFMRTTFGPYNLGAVALALSLGVTSMAWAQTASKTTVKDLPPGGEEIIITHERLGPLSEWASMQQHSAEYQRLKAKFDPSTGSSHVDNWNSDRAAAGPTSINGGFADESANAPTPSAIKAAEDAVLP